MKILLVVKSKMMENLGVMYLSAVIKKAGHECRIVSLSEVTLGENYFWEPDIIGFSIMTGDMDKFRKTAKTIRTYSNKIPKIIVGGPDPTFFPEGYIKWADEIFGGECEQAMVNYLESMKYGMNYHEFIHSDKWTNPLTHNIIDLMAENHLIFSNIDSIPWPDRTDFPNMKVRDFITSRGCPYSCSYCYNHRWASLFPDQKGVRVRSVDDVVAEIKAVNPEYVYFQDSCFGVSMDWMREFKEKYIFELGQGTIDFNHGGGRLPIYPVPPYQCHLRPEMVSDERMKLLKDSGCVAVRIALESASNRLRSLIGRHHTRLSMVRGAAELCKKHEIQLMLQNIIGLPGSSIEDDLFTLEMNIKYRPTYAWVSIYQPYPGTDLGDYCKNEGIYKGDYSDITDSFFETSFLEIEPAHREQLEILQKVFALCVDKGYMPTTDELTYKKLPALIHRIMRKDCDRKLYLGLL